ncbi:MAG: PH domain-containing protein [Flavobacterium nitrogenifigens]|uniref:PH domain-containing protein n=1 Tax=Flavobacterium nitrogenifigens TaxID=1617283 RepID=UPI002808F3EC|nr:PH domain-containing protein [Flavobacterium nitrogenifigens]MDQ8014038.1 PH domain-containing protein [Flavobacterium nitrogenifigens]
MEKFKSKIDIWLAFLLILIFGLALIQFVYNQDWIDLTFILLVIAFIVHMFATTFYIIENDKLRIKCGFLINILIEIKSIKKISETFNVLSSPALSLDRLEIVYGKYNSVLISPKEKKRFMEAIKSVNSEVEIVLKR